MEINIITKVLGEVVKPKQVIQNKEGRQVKSEKLKDFIIKNRVATLGVDANDLTNHKYNNLLVIYPIKRTKKRLHWVCKCDCGTYTIVESSKLRGNYTKSCGCLKLKQNGKGNTRLYDTWRGIIRRCNHPENQAYKYYGARGIKVCEKWEDDFLSFYEWSTENGYEEDLTIDRIDNDGDYTPDNCRWATMKEQANNRSSNNQLTYRGVTLNVTEWSKLLGWSHGVVSYRLRNGWSKEEALTLKE